MKKCMGCMRDYSESKTACPACGYSDADKLAAKSLIPDALTPETIVGGRFILGRVLDSSDFSFIYVAWDALLQKRVAVREYFPSGLGERGENGEIVCSGSREQDIFNKGLTAFVSETERLIRCQDIVNIIEIYRCVREKGTAYAVMQYLEGRTIQDDLDEGKRMAQDDVDRLMEILCTTLNSLHSRGLVHGNMSMENIYLSERGEVKLVDFGSAKNVISALMGSSVQILDQGYSAPELPAEAGPDRPADMYSLGAIYYRLATGKEPPVLTGRRKQKRIRLGDPAAEQVIAALMAPDPAARPENTDQVRDLLKQRQGGN